MHESEHTCLSLSILYFSFLSHALSHTHFSHTFTHTHTHTCTHTHTHVHTRVHERPKNPKMGKSEDPGASLMGLMKQMYQDGDDEMKRSIAKAWQESQDKRVKGDGPPEL